MAKFNELINKLPFLKVAFSSRCHATQNSKNVFILTEVNNNKYITLGSTDSNNCTLPQFINYKMKNPINIRNLPHVFTALIPVICSLNEVKTWCY